MGAELIFFNDEQDEQLTTLAATLGTSPHDAIAAAVEFYATAVQAPSGHFVTVRDTNTGKVFRRLLVVSNEVSPRPRGARRVLAIHVAVCLVVLALGNAVAMGIEHREWFSLGSAAVAVPCLVWIYLVLFQLHVPEPRREREPHQKAPKPDPGS